VVSVQKCLKACREMLSKGGPLLFFPEGTRSKNQKLSNFKVRARAFSPPAGYRFSGSKIETSFGSVFALEQETRDYFHCSCRRRITSQCRILRSWVNVPGIGGKFL
jgi:hypothetical protein